MTNFLSNFSESDFDMDDYNLLQNRMKDQLVPRQKSRPVEIEKELIQMPIRSGFRPGDTVKLLPDWKERASYRGIEVPQLSSFVNSTGQVIDDSEDGKFVNVDFSGQVIQLPTFVLRVFRGE